jgi:hypothetical protein
VPNDDDDDDDILMLDVYESVHSDIIMNTTNDMLIYRLIYYSWSALHVSGDVFAHHQENLTVLTTTTKTPAGSNLGEH